MQSDASGKALYGKHKSTVETTFGCIKEGMRFCQLKMRGLEGAEVEWQLAMSGMEFQTLVQLARDESIRMMEKCEKRRKQGRKGTRSGMSGADFQSK